MSADALMAMIAPGGQVGLAGALLLGLSMGLTACTITCLPFMGTWALGRAGSRREVLGHTGAFIAGRVLAYATLGALAGQLGQWLIDALQGRTGHLAIGAASVIAGGWLMLADGRPGGHDDAGTDARPLKFHRQRPTRAGHCGGARMAAAPPFLMGAALSLTPCAPLGWLIGICAASGSVAGGLGNGLAFGLGAGVTPLLLLVPAFGLLGRHMHAAHGGLRLWVRLGAAGVLIFLGTQRLFMA